MRRLLPLILIFVLASCSAPVPTSAPAPTTALQAEAQAPAASPTAALPAVEEAAPAPSATVSPQPSATQEPAASATPAPTVAPAATATVFSNDPALSGAAWEWTAGSAPGCDLLVFGADGSLALQADCVSGQGSYQAAGESLQLTLPPQVGGEFSRRLAGVSGYVLRGGELVLSAPDGELEFTPRTLLPAPSAAGSAASAVLQRAARVYLGPGLTYPVLGILPAGASVPVSLRIYQYPFWGVTMPGLPDGVGWIQSAATSVSGEDAIVYTQPELLQVGGDVFLWPDLDDPRASISDEARIYAGPGDNYALVMAGLPGDTFYVLGQSADGAYLALNVPMEVVPGGLAWVRTDQVETRNVESVPVMAAPPAPGVSRFSQPAAGEAFASPLTQVHIRGGPGVEYTSYAGAARGEIYLINGITPDGIWYRIQVPQGISKDQTAWISAPNVHAFDAAAVSVVQYPMQMPTLRADTLGPMCQIVSQSPKDFSIIGLGVTFTYKVEILNDSGSTWSRGDIDFVYIDNIDNAPLHTGANRLDLEEHVAAGDTAVVEFEARAPTKHAGVFGERWVVRKAGQTVCAFTYQMRIK